MGRVQAGFWLTPALTGIFLIVVALSVTEVWTTGAYADDPAIALTSMGIGRVSADAGATGDAVPLELAAEMPELRTTLHRENYVYRFRLEEKSPDSLQEGETLQIEVYGNDGQSSVLLATLYAQQASADSSRVEGVVATIHLGSATAIPDGIEVVVTRE